MVLQFDNISGRSCVVREREGVRNEGRLGREGWWRLGGSVGGRVVYN